MVVMLKTGKCSCCSWPCDGMTGLTGATDKLDLIARGGEPGAPAVGVEGTRNPPLTKPLNRETRSYVFSTSLTSFKKTTAIHTSLIHASYQKASDHDAFLSSQQDLTTWLHKESDGISNSEQSPKTPLRSARGKHICWYLGRKHVVPTPLAFLCTFRIRQLKDTISH